MTFPEEGGTSGNMAEITIVGRLLDVRLDLGPILIPVGQLEERLGVIEFRSRQFGPIDLALDILRFPVRVGPSSRRLPPGTLSTQCWSRIELHDLAADLEFLQEGFSASFWASLPRFESARSRNCAAKVWSWAVCMTRRRPDA